jgi:tRNA/tmRNA/rRNA uracil-C5-methylase (TrmA/RlmC/RlmD family)
MGFRPEKSREVVDIEQCEIAAEEINKSLKKFKADLRNKNQEFIPESLTLWSNWQYDETELEIPRKFIVRRIRDKSIKVPADGFFQANELLIEQLISLVEEKTGLKGNEILLDAYCGSGLFSLFLAEKAGLIYGIEQDSHSVDCAIHNCRKAGGSGRVKIIEGDAANIIKYKLLKEDVKIDTALIDPPRTGCEERALYNLSLLKPRKILYLSCNPATQARDVKYLVSQGYALNELQPLDMFPRTKHIEVLAEMERREDARYGE